MVVLKLLGGLTLTDASGVVGGRAAQKRRLAVLAILAVPQGRRLSRQKIMACLWPESREEEARHLLSVGIYELRRALGEHVILSEGEELRINWALLETDVARFEDAVERGDVEAAIKLYAGPFLDGVHAVDSQEFEDWAEAERSRLAAKYRIALEAAARARVESNDRQGAVELWQRLAHADRFNGRVALELMRALEAVGERAAAIQQARIHAALLREEFNADPDAAVAAYAERLKVVIPTAAEAAPDRLVSAPTPLPPLQHQLAPAQTTNQPGSHRQPRPALLWSSAGAALLLIVALALFAPASPLRLGQGIPTIAVLPLVNLSDDAEQQYFADGMTDQIITELAQVKSLRVISRTSVVQYKGAKRPLTEIARALGANLVIEGTVLRAGDRVRVTAQLIDASTDTHLWSNSYERGMSDVLALQRDVSLDIAQQTHARLTSEEQSRLAQVRPVAPEAYDAFLRGQQARFNLDLQKAVEHFQTAVRIDSAWALAHAALADTYSAMNFFRAGSVEENDRLGLAAARRAIALDPSLSGAHGALARMLFGKREWQEAMKALRQALELGSGDPNILGTYAEALGRIGQFDEALAYARKARDLDPLSLERSINVVELLIAGRRYEEAERQLRVVMEVSTNDQRILSKARENLAYVLAFTDRGTEAVEQMRAAGHSESRSAEFAYVLARAGQRDRAASILPNIDNAYDSAVVQIALGDANRAFQSLESAYRARNDGMLFLKFDRRLDPLHRDRRFSDLMHRVGIP